MVQVDQLRQKVFRHGIALKDASDGPAKKVMGHLEPLLSSQLRSADQAMVARVLLGFEQDPVSA